MPTATMGTAGLSAISEVVDAVITARGVSKRFGNCVALDNFDIDVPRGSVYALLGRNGAGKSTLIQLAMGVLEPGAGSLRVLGLDPIRRGVDVRRRIGYIPDRLPMYDWMTVGELLRFVAGAYDNWSAIDEQELMAKFGIRRDQKVGGMSRGYRALLSLVMAMAHRPDVVLLDECTSGMDAIARREFERSVIDTLQAGGKTVLFASHQIDEMERICDWVGVIRDGRLLLQMPLDWLKESVKLLRLSTVADAPVSLIDGCAILDQRRVGSETLAVVRIADPENWRPVPAPVIEIKEVVSLSLEDIFVALAGHGGTGQ